MIDEKALLAGQRAAMESNGCGYSWDGERVFCDDPSLPEPYTSCQCKKDARAAITAYLSARSAEPVKQWRWRYRNGPPNWRGWVDGAPVVPFTDWDAGLYEWQTRTLYTHPKEAPDV